MRPSSKSHPLDAVVAGYLGVDIAPGFPSGRAPVPASDLFRPGKLIETEGVSLSLGGVVANTGLAMKRFGRRVELMEEGELDGMTRDANDTCMRVVR